MKALVTSWLIDFDHHDADGPLPGLNEVLTYPNLRSLTYRRSDEFYREKGVPGMQQIMLRLKQLRDGRPAHMQFELRFLDSKDLDFRNIHTVHLVADFTTTELLRIMFLPRVRVVKATWLDIMQPPNLSPEFATATSNITHLEIHGGTLWRIHPSTIHAVLSHCPHLRILRLRVPMLSILCGAMEIWSEVHEPVSPA